MKYSFLNPELSIDERVADLLSQLSLEEKLWMITSDMHGVERLGIKHCAVGTEVARGWSSHDETQFCTVFPQTIGLAATFDKATIKKMGETTGKELRAYNNATGKSLFCFGPTVDCERDVRWGRHEEAYGEDPYLSKTMSDSYTSGIVGEGKYIQAAPLLKHFAANNTEKNRSSYDAKIPERLKMEYYYEPFRESIVKGHAFGVMAAYNKLNGYPGILNPDLRRIVKDQWGAKVVVSDGGGFNQVMTSHKVTKSHAETLKYAYKAGTNAMLDTAQMLYDAAKESLEKGFIVEEDINNAIKDLLYIRFRLGEFDPAEGNPYVSIGMDQVNTEEDKKLSLLMAQKQVILLKNQGLLPVSKKTNTIAVIGPQADENFMDWYTGASSYDVKINEGFKTAFKDSEILCDNGRDHVKIKNTYTGKFVRIAEDGGVFADASEENAAVFEKYDWGWGYINYMSTISKKMLTEDDGNWKCTAKDAYMWFVRPIMRPNKEDGKTGFYITGWDNRYLRMNEDQVTFAFSGEEKTEKDFFSEVLVSDGTERCKKLSEKADVTFCCLGNHPVQVAREGYDRSEITLPPKQEELLDASFAVNKNTVLVMVSGYPYGIEKYENRLPAILFTTHAGPELGNALASVVNGDYNPAGRSPQTWYKSTEKLPDIFDYDIEKTGMTYLYFKGEALYPFGYGLSYSTFDYSDLKLEKNAEGIKASLCVTNTSDKDGEDVPQLYFTVEDSSVSRPEKKLCGYDRVFLKAGESKIVMFNVDFHSLEYYDIVRGKFILEEGEYKFMAGGNSRDIKTEGKIKL